MGRHKGDSSETRWGRAQLGLWIANRDNSVKWNKVDYLGTKETQGSA